MAYEVLIFAHQLSTLGRDVAQFFKADVVHNVSDLSELMQRKRYRAVVYDQSMMDTLDLTECQSLLQQEILESIPLIVLANTNAIKDKIKALEIGCDDWIDSKTKPDEVYARITKSIFHQIANAQLKQRSKTVFSLSTANDLEKTDLQICLDFFMRLQYCDNLDQLGQLFFAVIQPYAISCSLQMRSAMGKKDMEAHGMAKHLESQLLYQLKDNGRYVDFGSRTVINCENVSLLIKNMPIYEVGKVEVLKESLFYLLQGVHSRIAVLEERHEKLKHYEAQYRTIKDVTQQIRQLKDAYNNTLHQYHLDAQSVAEQLQILLSNATSLGVSEKEIKELTSRLIGKLYRVADEDEKIKNLIDCFEAYLIDNSVLVKPSNNASGDPSQNVIDLFQ